MLLCCVLIYIDDKRSEQINVGVTRVKILVFRVMRLPGGAVTIYTNHPDGNLMHKHNNIKDDMVGK